MGFLAVRFFLDFAIGSSCHIHAPLSASLYFKSYQYPMMELCSRSLSDIAVRDEVKGCGQMRGRRPGKTGGVFAGIH